MSLKSQMTHHVGEILKVRSHPVPWAWMLISGLSALAPLLVGAANHEVGLSIFGSLTGYLIVLCDHQGTLRHRLAMAFISLLMCEVCFSLGVFAQHSLWGLITASLFLVYPIGLFSGQGAELERIFVFGGIEFFVARYAISITPVMIPHLSCYFIAAFFTAALGMLISRVTLQKTSHTFTHLKQAYLEVFNLNPSRHYYAVTYFAAILLGIFLVEYFQIERGYWVLVTVLLMMKPNRKESIYRITQRIFGTLLGVIVGQLIITFQPPLAMLISGVFIFALLVPYVWNKNYWLVAFCATNLVICLLSIAQFGHIDHTLTLIRFKVTLIGCAISVVAILVSQKIERFFGLPHFPKTEN